ncbi:PQQ-binding-like beta-propeller repeat protein [Glycomyces sp. NPDC048151]|uniref:outer membrane protein assembly factor BamB family protein n=1 Tax=Glycomyces sp. NPDC048151 TaxID=3364002 RepID=UPI003714012A
MRRVLVGAGLPLMLVAACQSDAGTDANTSDTVPATELGADLDVSTVGATTELAWSATTFAGMTAVVGDVVVYYSLDENQETVLSGAAADTGELLWQLGQGDDGIEGTSLDRWLPPKPEKVEAVEVDGVPAVLARALDGDVSDASSECGDATAQHAVVAIEAATGEILWSSHPAPPGPENNCLSLFEFDMVTTEDIAVVNGSGNGLGSPLASVALDLDSGEVLWQRDGVEMTRSTRNAIIGVRNITDEARCGFDYEFLYTGFDTDNGEPLWELDPCEDPTVLGLLAEQVLFEVGEGDTAELRALDAFTGEVLASHTGGTLPEYCPTDGARLIVCPVPAESAEDGESALLLYDAETASFTVLDLESASDAGFPYLIWQDQIAFYSNDANTTRLFDIATSSETAAFPGWWSGAAGSFRLSTPPAYLAEVESELEVYTVTG